jgi:hypothetical protein
MSKRAKGSHDECLDVAAIDHARGLAACEYGPWSSYDADGRITNKCPACESVLASVLPWSCSCGWDHSKGYGMSRRTVQGPCNAEPELNPQGHPTGKWHVHISDECEAEIAEAKGKPEKDRDEKEKKLAKVDVEAEPSFSDAASINDSKRIHRG